MEKCCFITGHRPNRFNFPENDPRCDKIKSAIRSEIIRLHEQEGIRGVWVGGAAGVDTWAAEIVLELREQDQYRNLELHVAIPFPEHGDTFAPQQKERYQRILKECTDTGLPARIHSRAVSASRVTLWPPVSASAGATAFRAAVMGALGAKAVSVAPAIKPLAVT